jgi:hypothetical protein
MGGIGTGLSWRELAAFTVRGERDIPQLDYRGALGVVGQSKSPARIPVVNADHCAVVMSIPIWLGLGCP